jgi:hypothetical protein
VQSLLRGDGVDLVGRYTFGKHSIEIEGCTNGLRSVGPVTRDHDDARHTGGAQCLYCPRGFSPEFVTEEECADNATVDGNKNAKG